MAMPVVCPRTSLSRNIDVQVSISRPQTEIATDMTMICFLSPDIELYPDNSRIIFVQSIDDVESYVPYGSSTWWAANAFFARSVRPRTLAIARVFLEPQAAGLVAGTRQPTTEITDGAFTLEVNGELATVENVALTAGMTLEQIVTAIRTALPASLTVAEVNNTLKISTVTTGDTATLSYASAPTAGTDISTMLGLTQEASAILWQGYTPEGLPGEAALAATAARCSGSPIYGWILDRSFRDTQEQKDFSAWIASRDPAITILCTNAPSAYNTADTTNIGYYTFNNNNRRAGVIYHDNPQVYPDMSYLALALSVNYALEDSTLTMKFKELDGIPTSPITSTELAALTARRINSYVTVGNNSNTTRDGVQSGNTWFTDSLVNLDNYKEELQVAVFNVFLRNKKVQYTSAGQDKLVSAIKSINDRYTRNGVFAPREVEANTETGILTMPATTINPTNVAYATASERASRVGPPIQVTAYEAGAIHVTSITVDVIA